MMTAFRWAVLFVLTIWSGGGMVKSDYTCLPEQQQLGQINSDLKGSSHSSGAAVLIRVEAELYICEARNAADNHGDIWCRPHESQMAPRGQIEWRRILSLPSLVTGLWVSNVELICYVAVVTKEALLVFAAGKDTVSQLLILEPAIAPHRADAVIVTPVAQVAATPVAILPPVPGIRLGPEEMVNDEAQRLVVTEPFVVSKAKPVVTAPSTPLPPPSHAIHMGIAELADNNEVVVQVISTSPPLASTHPTIGKDRFLGDLEVIEHRNPAIIPGAKRIIVRPVSPYTAPTLPEQPQQSIRVFPTAQVPAYTTPGIRYGDFGSLDADNRDPVELIYLFPRTAKSIKVYPRTFTGQPVLRPAQEPPVGIHYTNDSPHDQLEESYPERLLPATPLPARNEEAPAAHRSHRTMARKSVLGSIHTIDREAVEQEVTFRPFTLLTGSAQTLLVHETENDRYATSSGINYVDGGTDGHQPLSEDYSEIVPDVPAVSAAVSSVQVNRTAITPVQGIPIQTETFASPVRPAVQLEPVLAQSAHGIRYTNDSVHSIYSESEDYSEGLTPTASLTKVASPPGPTDDVQSHDILLPTVAVTLDSISLPEPLSSIHYINNSIPHTDYGSDLEDYGENSAPLMESHSIALPVVTMQAEQVVPSLTLPGIRYTNDSIRYANSKFGDYGENTPPRRQLDVVFPLVPIQVERGAPPVEKPTLPGLRYSNVSIESEIFQTDDYSDIVSTKQSADVIGQPPASIAGLRPVYDEASQLYRTLSGIRYVNDSIKANPSDVEDNAELNVSDILTTLGLPIPSHVIPNEEKLPVTDHTRHSETISPFSALPGIGYLDDGIHRDAFVASEDYSEVEISAITPVAKLDETSLVYGTWTGIRYVNDSIKANPSDVEDNAELNVSDTLTTLGLPVPSHVLPNEEKLLLINHSETMSPLSALPGIGYLDDGIHRDAFVASEDYSEVEISAITPVAKLDETSLVYGTWTGIRYVNDSIKANPSDVEDNAELNVSDTLTTLGLPVPSHVIPNEENLPVTDHTRHSETISPFSALPGIGYMDDGIHRDAFVASEDYSEVEISAMTPVATLTPSLQESSTAGVHPTFDETSLIYRTLSGIRYVNDSIKANPSDIEDNAELNVNVDLPALDAPDRVLPNEEKLLLINHSETMSPLSALPGIGYLDDGIHRDAFVASEDYSETETAAMMPVTNMTPSLQESSTAGVHPTFDETSLVYRTLSGIRYVNDSIKANPSDIEDNAELTVNVNLAALGVPERVLPNEEKLLLINHSETMSPLSALPGIGYLDDGIHRDAFVASEDYSEVEISAMTPVATLTPSLQKSSTNEVHPTFDETSLVYRTMSGIRYVNDSIKANPSDVEDNAELNVSDILTTLGLPIPSHVIPNEEKLPVTDHTRHSETISPFSALPGIGYLDDGIHRDAFVASEDYSEVEISAITPVAKLDETSLVYGTWTGIRYVNDSIKANPSDVEDNAELNVSDTLTTLGLPVPSHVIPNEENLPVTDHTHHSETISPFSALPGIGYLDDGIHRDAFVASEDYSEVEISAMTPVATLPPSLQEYRTAAPTAESATESTIARVSYGDGDYDEVERPVTGQEIESHVDDRKETRYQNLSVITSSNHLLSDQNIHHDVFSSTSNNFSEVSDVNSGIKSEPALVVNIPPSSVNLPQPIMRGVTGDADYDEAPGLWQYSRQVTLPVSSPTWLFFNGSPPAILDPSNDRIQPDYASAQPDIRSATQRLNIAADIPDYVEEGYQSSTIQAVSVPAGIQALSETDGDNEESQRPGQSVAAASNYTLHDRTLSFEEIYGRPMVIVRSKPSSSNSSNPKVQMYLDQTTDIHQYLLNPIQFPVVISGNSSTISDGGLTSTAQQFPLLGRVRSYKSPNGYSIHRDAALDRQLDEDSHELQVVQPSTPLDVLVTTPGPISSEPFIKRYPPVSAGVQYMAGEDHTTFDTILRLPDTGVVIPVLPETTVTASHQIQIVAVNASYTETRNSNAEAGAMANISAPHTDPAFIPLTGVRYTDEHSPREPYTESEDYSSAVDNREDILQRLSVAELPTVLQPPSAAISIRNITVSSPTAAVAGIRYTDISIHRADSEFEDYSEMTPGSQVARSQPTAAYVDGVIVTHAPPVLTYPRGINYLNDGISRQPMDTEDYSQVVPAAVGVTEAVVAPWTRPQTEAITSPPAIYTHSSLRGMMIGDYDYEETVPVTAPTSTFPPPVTAAYSPTTGEVAYVQTQPGARRIQIIPANPTILNTLPETRLPPSSHTPVRGYRWRKPPVENRQPAVPLLPIPEQRNNQVPFSHYPPQGQVHPTVILPEVGSPQQQQPILTKPATRRNRFGQEIPLFGQVAPWTSQSSFQMQNAPPADDIRQKPTQQQSNPFEKDNRLFTQDRKPQQLLPGERRNRFGQSLPAGVGYPAQAPLTRLDVRTPKGWIPMTAPSPPKSIPSPGFLPIYPSNLHLHPAYHTSSQQPAPSRENVKHSTIFKNPSAMERPSEETEPAVAPPPHLQAATPQKGQETVSDGLKNESLLSSFLMNKTGSDSPKVKSTVHNICEPGVTLENRTVTEYVDCEESDISELTITMTPKNGSGSFHYEIVSEGSTPNGRKFSIDESNGLVYASAQFSPKTDNRESSSLGPDITYQVKVRVIDELCDHSDEAFMSIAFRCRKASSDMPIMSRTRR